MPQVAARAGIGHNSHGIADEPPSNKVVREDLEDTPALARRTKTSESYWHKLRVAGLGPDYIKIGASVRYHPAVVDAWLASQTRKSTSA